MQSHSLLRFPRDDDDGIVVVVFLVRAWSSKSTARLGKNAASRALSFWRLLETFSPPRTPHFSATPPHAPHRTAMGKRTTIAYSSEDFKRRKKDDDGDNTNDTKNATLKTYYCKCCSNHVLITDCNLFALPRRRVDASIILDATKYVCRLRAKKENVATVIRRKNGEILEKQTRYYCGKVPVCYECNDEKGKVYVLDGALRSFEKGSKKDAQLPVPPCIRTGKGGKVIFPVRVIEGQEKRAVIDIGAENVSVSLQTRKTDDPKGVERELLEFLSETIKCR